MNGARLQNVKQCFTLISKTGEGLRLGYGYGGVCHPLSVANIALEGVIGKQRCENPPLQAFSQSARLIFQELC